MQAIQAQMTNPIMARLIYGIGAYIVISPIYARAVYKAPEVAELKKAAADVVAPPARTTSSSSAAVSSSVGGGEAVSNVMDQVEGKKVMVPPVLQQLTSISDRLARIEKALGI